MPEKVEQKTAKTLSQKDLDSISEFMRQEFMRRKGRRHDLEAHWKEIDRQIRMDAREREVQSGQKKDWYPDTELPLQFNALEVIAADARRLKFPRGTEWFSVSAEVSDAYQARWERRREGRALLSGAGFSFQPDSPAKALAQQIELTQDTANVLSKVVLDHYHRMYDFRSQIDLLDAEAIKYGTNVARVRPVRPTNTFMDFRGNKTRSLEGPAVIPCSIKKTYLDDTPHAVLHEGVMIAPLVLRVAKQRLDNLLIAARKGGKDRGWLPAQIKDLKPLDKGRNVDVIEGEGDFIIPKSRGSLHLPNFLITIAIGQGEARVVRMRENPTPFLSYVPGYYMRDDVESPYGVSPLMKGETVQEAGTEVFNDMLAVARLNGDPPLVYDRHDTNLAAGRGPNIHPGAQFGTDSPNAVEVLKIGDMGALLNAYLALIKQHEDLTGSNDARRGAPVRSHTTTGGIELEASRGISRTDDFVSTQEQGQIRTILYMEWEIIKNVMRAPQPVSVGAGGIEGWVEIAAQDLPDNAVFFVHGSSGALNERERAQNFFTASNFAVQLAASAPQVGQQLDINLQEITTEAFTLSGIQNAGRFIGSTQAGATALPGGPGVPGADPGAAEDDLAGLAPPQIVGGTGG